MTTVEPDTLTRARRLREVGYAENSAGRPARAARVLHRALRLVQAERSPEAADLHARILVTLGLAEAELHGVSRGLALLDEAADLGSGRPGLGSLIATQRGLLLLRGGQADGALAAFDVAEACFRDASSLDRCMTWLNRSVIHLERGDLARARLDLERCAVLARKDGIGVLQAKALYNLGYLSFLAGDLPRALRVMDEADSLEVEVNWGVAKLDRARVLAEAGLAGDADATLVEAARYFTANRLSQDLAEAELTRAVCALLAGQAPAALAFARRARTRFRRRGNERWRRNAELVAVQAALAAGTATGALAATASRLAAELAVEGPSVQARTAALAAAEALSALGRTGQAVAAAAGAGPSEHGEAISVRLYRRYLAARLGVATGERAAAAREISAGLRELAGYQAGFGSIDLQTASAVHGRRLAELGRAIAVEDGSALRVLAAVERGRAVSSRLPAVLPPADERTAALLAELRHTIEEQRAAVSDPARLAHLGERRRQLERQIRARAWTVAGERAVRRPASGAALRAGLTAAQATLICYLRVDGQLHAVVLGPRRASLHALGSVQPVDALIRRVRADLDALAQPRLPGGLRAAAGGSLRNALTDVDERLLAPLRLPGTRLVITPAGLLATLPWGLLPSLAGTPVIVAPTGTAWLAADQTRPQGVTGMLALAGPDLPRGDEEVAGVSAAWAGAPALAAPAAPAAGRAALREALASRAVVHVAAHGTHQSDNPLFSSVRLADGPLFAHELDRAAEHVVLSACELGLATIRPGDEALGLTSVLLRLGTRCVVAGVARVRDDVAAQVMVGYHTRLAAGADSAAALAQALGGADPDSPAPFVCFGAGWRAGGP